MTDYVYTIKQHAIEQSKKTLSLESARLGKQRFSKFI